MIKTHKSDILQRVLLAIVQYWTENQIPPTVEDITKLLGYTSRSNILGYLRELEELGYIKMDRKIFRSIVVVGATWTPPKLTHIPTLGEFTGEIE